ncbi:helix-turn-helix transcriptional regulator [Vibrio sp. PNB23_22_6]|uniref:helix-turn-helix transcriptional regulator n=1 Tax=unclassified Vibrio TaxID=2614977 RepID=UPI00406A8A40
MKLIDIKEVSEITTAGKSTIYKYISDGEFPLPIKIGRNNRWIKEEVTDWLLQKKEERDCHE